jgi:ribosome-associated translation inhibitor RaiA
MNIQFRQGSEDISQKLIDRAGAKIGKLSRLINERNYEAQVHVDIERESGSHSSDRMWRTSINLDLAGDRFNASEVGDTAEKATDLAIKELKHELQRAKAKSGTTAKREGGLFKRLMQGF